MFLLDKILALFSLSPSKESQPDPEATKTPVHNNHDKSANNTMKMMPLHRKCLPKVLLPQPETTASTDDFSRYTDGIIHMFRATVGTGILALPVAFSQAGYLGGICAVMFVTYLTYYCSTILANCQRELSRRDKGTVPTYQGTVEAAFLQGPPSLRPLAPLFVTSTNILLLVGQVGGVCVYFIFIASNIKAAAAPYIELDLRMWTVMLSVPILAINLVASLKKLTLVSSFGNLVLLSSVTVVFYYVFREPISLEGRIPFGDFADLPRYFGTIFFASGSINMVLPLQSEMANPEILEGRCGVLSMNSFTTGSLYVIFGFLGYIKYGSDAKGSVTLNLPSGELLAAGVQVLLALSVMTATALQNYISISIIWDDYLDKRITKHRSLFQYLLRIFIVLFILGVSVLVPNLELLVSVTGILGQCSLAATFPCLVHVLTYYEQPSCWGYIRLFWRDVVCVLFSLFILLTSIWSLAFAHAS